MAARRWLSAAVPRAADVETLALRAGVTPATVTRHRGGEEAVSHGTDVGGGPGQPLPTPQALARHHIDGRTTMAVREQLAALGAVVAALQGRAKLRGAIETVPADVTPADWAYLAKAVLAGPAPAHPLSAQLFALAATRGSTDAWYSLAEMARTGPLRMWGTSFM
jgi:hypothetical protein